MGQRKIYISSHDKMSRNVILFFVGKCCKIHVVIRDLFVVNRDKKIRIHDKKITNRDFFSSLGMALYTFSVWGRRFLCRILPVTYMMPIIYCLLVRVLVDS